MKKLILAAFAALSLLSSCDLNTDQVYIYAKYLLADPQGGSYEASLIATGAWTATINAPDDLKMTITPESGTGNTQVQIIVEPYTGSEDYTEGYIQLSCGKALTSFPVYQVSEEYKKKMEEEASTSAL